MLKIFNTLSKTTDELKPISASEVKIYSCGPTVYDNVHIGNLVSFIYADTLNRALRANNTTVKHVMNITDVDDKTIKRSRESYPDDSPEEALKKLTDRYEGTFKNDIAAIGNNVSALNFIQATESIELMKELITKLLNDKFAYIADDGIYFSIENYVKSGKKYGQLLDIQSSNTSRERINNDEYDKQSVHDFALWKFAQEDEPAWSFLIDNKDYLGRPGWHIECSAMSAHSLGIPFDIHTGGVDLIFPHHENEIAQSTAGQDSDRLANVFFHNEHLLIEGRKMSKSLGNVYSLTDIIEHKFDPIAFRLLVLQSHYRSQSNFSWDLLASAQNRLTNLRNLSSLRFQLVNDSDREAYNFKGFREKITKAMDSDLNSPEALAHVAEFNRIFDENLVSTAEKDDFISTINFVDDYFGLNLSSVEDVTGEIKQLIKERDEARGNNDWSKSDQIRDKLHVMGIDLRDYKSQSVWTRQ